MKRGFSAAILGAAVLALVLGTSGVSAQGGAARGSGPAHYDVAAEVTVTGTVEEVRQVTQAGPMAGTHVKLTAAAGPMELALGPSHFMTDKKYTLAKGDQVEVIGARTQVEGRDVILVRVIKKGPETMTFRDPKGFPLWSGRGGLTQ